MPFLRQLRGFREQQTMKHLGLAGEPQGSGKGFLEGPPMILRILSQVDSVTSHIKPHSPIHPTGIWVPSRVILAYYRAGEYQRPQMGHQHSAHLCRLPHSASKHRHWPEVVSRMIPTSVTVGSRDSQRLSLYMTPVACKIHPFYFSPPFTLSRLQSGLHLFFLATQICPQIVLGGFQHGLLYQALNLTV